MSKSDAILFTFEGQPVGILVRQYRGFLFYSSIPPFDGLDGVTYRTKRSARLALRRYIATLEATRPAQLAAA
jgi:hypothetical protein